MTIMSAVSFLFAAVGTVAIAVVLVAIARSETSVPIAGASGATSASAVPSSTFLRQLEARSLTWRGPLDARYKSEHISDEDKKRLDLYPPDYKIVDQNGTDAAETADDKGTLAIVDTVAEEKEVEQAIDEVKDVGKGELLRRKFVKYEPSKWELGWMGAITELTGDRAICDTLLNGKHQKAQVHKFMTMMCSARPDPPNDHWCYYHDHNHYVWYNSANLNAFELYIDKTPLVLDGVDFPMPTSVNFLENEEDWGPVASKFTFLDETTGEEYHEYIEPLIAQLRFPLAGCLDNKPLLADFASFVIPPPSLSRVDGRTIMYDIGSNDWSRMEYIVEEWCAHDAGFTYLITYAPREQERTDVFAASVPERHKAHIYRHFFDLVDQPSDKVMSFFLPSKIQEQARKDDYIMVKLDRANAQLKQNLMKYILESVNDSPPSEGLHIDELFWEINASGNYVLESWFDTNLKFDELSSLTLTDAYQMLSELRYQGIRAHAWI